MILGGNRETSRAHIVIPISKWVKIEANPEAAGSGDGKCVPRVSLENSSCLVKTK